eukprot:65240-Chlamydomonas_euryale.AAC.1
MQEPARLQDGARGEGRAVCAAAGPGAGGHGRDARLRSLRGLQAGVRLRRQGHAVGGSGGVRRPS